MLQRTLKGKKTLKVLAGWFVRFCLVALLAFVVPACGDRVPQTVVEGALNFEILHVGDETNALVGNELLNRWASIRSVKVRSKKPVRIQTKELTYPGFDIEGTFRSLVHPSDRKMRYQRTEPFRVTLAHWIDEENEIDRWLLARRSLDTSPDRSPLWTVMDFLPPHEPQPQSLNRSQQHPQKVDGSNKEDVGARINETSSHQAFEEEFW